MEPTVALDLPFQTVEQIALELDDLTAAQAGHMDVIPLRAPLVIMFLALHMHQVELVNQSVALEQVERAVDGYAVNSRIELTGVTQDLRRIQVLLRGLHHAQNGTPLVGEAQPSRRQGRLQTSGGFGFRQWHSPM